MVQCKNGGAHCKYAYSLPDLRITYIFSQRPTVNSLSAITAQTRQCTKTYKRVLRGFSRVQIKSIKNTQSIADLIISLKTLSIILQ